MSHFDVELADFDDFLSIEDIVLLLDLPDGFVDWLLEVP